MTVVTLLTDFGISDTYVGMMKGVIASIAPDAHVVDLTHDVPPQDVQAGAFHLMVAYGYFPPGTVHVAVVDPGVGTGRAIITVRAGGHLFVGPDNGVLRWAVESAGGAERAVRVENRDYALPVVSATFHGRDVMAPAAAHLARGLPLESLGPAAETLAGEAFPESHAGRGIVVHVDRFGNCITNLRPPLGATVDVLGRHLPVVRTYGDAPPRQPVALVGSASLLEIAINGESAAARLGIGRGTPVQAISP